MLCYVVTGTQSLPRIEEQVSEPCSPAGDDLHVSNTSTATATDLDMAFNEDTDPPVFDDTFTMLTHSACDTSNQDTQAACECDTVLHGRCEGCSLEPAVLDDGGDGVSEAVSEDARLSSESSYSTAPLPSSSDNTSASIPTPHSTHMVRSHTTAGNVQPLLDNVKHLKLLSYFLEHCKLNEYL